MTRETPDEPNDGRAAAASLELRPRRDLLEAARRYGPVVAICAVLTGALTFIAITLAPAPDTAVARVGLTERVNWPFYDVERERQVQLVHDPGFRGRVAAALPAGSRLLDLDVRMPIDQAYVEVVATTSDATAAPVAADSAAAMLVEASRQRLRGDAEAREAQADAELATIDKAIAAYSAQLDAARLPSAQLDAVQEQRTAEYYRRRLFLEARDRAELDLSDPNSSVLELLRTAEVDTAQHQDAAGLAVLAAAVAALVALMAIAYYDVRHARIRSAVHARLGAARDLPTPRWDAPGTDARADCVRQIVECGAPARIAAIAEAPGGRSWPVVVAIAEALRDAGGRVVTVGVEEPAADLTLELSDVPRSAFWSGAFADDAADALTRCRWLHLRLGRGAVVGPSTLAPIAQHLARRADLLLVHLGPLAEPSGLWVPVPDQGVLVCIGLRRTRQSDLRAASAALGHRRATVAAVVVQETADERPAAAALAPTDAFAPAAVDGPGPRAVPAPRPA